jgi:hypothetical protein
VQPILFTVGNIHRSLSSALRKGVAPFMPELMPIMGPIGLTISGVSRDSTGAALGGCTCTLFRVNTAGPLTTFTQLAVTTSDGSGNYSFVVGTDGPYRVTFDLDGAPIRAGISLKTLAGS